MRVKKAVKVLTNAIKEDEEFYRAYQANIAMAFYDEYYRNRKIYKNKNDLHGIANRAAKNFINLWSK